MFIYVGGESDEWVEDALKEAINKDMVVINLLDALGDSVKEEELVDGMEGEEEEGEEDEEEGPEYDEHVWLSLRNAKTLCQIISDELCKIDPENKSIYEANVQAYISELDTLDKEYETAVSNTTVELQSEATATDNTPKSDVDVDLTELSSTMVYSEVYNMMYTPANYIGRTVRMSGTFVAYTNQDESQYYPAVIIADATACCSQGLEFVLEGNPSYPEGYPEMEMEITVVGVFETYEEDGNIYCRLKNAKID